MHWTRVGPTNLRREGIENAEIRPHRVQPAGLYADLSASMSKSSAPKPSRRPRCPEPFCRSQTRSWYVQIDGPQIPLGRKRKPLQLLTDIVQLLLVQRIVVVAKTWHK